MVAAANSLPLTRRFSIPAADSPEEKMQIGKGVDYVTRMNLYNLIFQMVELLYKLYYTN